MRISSRKMTTFLVVLSLHGMTMPAAQGMACDARRYTQSCDEALKIVEAYKAQIAADTGAAAAATGATISRNGLTLALATQDAAGADKSAAAHCQKQLDQCKAECTGPTGPAQFAICKENLTPKIAASEQSAANLAADSANSAAIGDQTTSGAPEGGGGLGDGLGKILPFVAIGAIACLATKCLGGGKDKDKEKDSALLPNGAIDCSKPDAGKYSDCDQYLIGQCSALLNMTSMTPNCTNFTARYCATQREPDSTEQAQLANGAIVQLNLGGAGAGQDSSYCQTSYATAFCKGGANSACPACLQLQANQSAPCQANPALCIAQNSPSQMAEAKITCPGDPAIALYEKSGAAGGTGNPGAPAVILPPASTQTLASVPGAAGGISTDGSSGGISTSSIGGGANSESAVREGQTGYNSGSGNVGASATTAGRSSVNSREVASSGGGLAIASAGAGPASDVQGQFGPSLFATGSQVIRQRCQKKLINNCP